MFVSSESGSERQRNGDKQRSRKIEKDARIEGKKAKLEQDRKNNRALKRQEENTRDGGRRTKTNGRMDE